MVSLPAPPTSEAVSLTYHTGVMGQANAERALNYIRTLAQFISQPEYSPVIQFFGFINEPNGNAIGKQALGSFFIEAHNAIREITGYGEGNGPMLGMHDGFLGPSSWYGFAEGADRLAMDQHTYMVSDNVFIR
jgi:glucan 1,3-beta-glucosidase